MPATNITINRLAFEMEGTDPKNSDAVESFYYGTFPRYSEEVRAEIFDWITSLIEDATDEDFVELFRALDKFGNFRQKSKNNPYFEDANYPQKGEGILQYVVGI